MNDDLMPWIIGGLVLLALIIGAVILLGKRKGAKEEENRRSEARRIREEAERERVEVQRREAEVARSAADARLAQAEADVRAADAAELAAKARQEADQVGGSRAELDERLRRADALDPDVPGDGQRDVPGGGGTPDRGVEPVEAAQGGALAADADGRADAGPRTDVQPEAR